MSVTSSWRRGKGCAFMLSQYGLELGHRKEGGHLYGHFLVQGGKASECVRFHTEADPDDHIAQSGKRHGQIHQPRLAHAFINDVRQAAIVLKSRGEAVIGYLKPRRHQALCLQCAHKYLRQYPVNQGWRTCSFSSTTTTSTAKNTAWRSTRPCSSDAERGVRSWRLWKRAWRRFGPPHARRRRAERRSGSGGGVS
ncbi:hypothetical protein FIU94_18795 (plasmid) [Sulfitobacter sp. THAF37]|nr:hypothetical protein FIU94_18795 [Sulfitobacter sp. THAF37]